ncbi:hypothetical protein ACFVRU_29600 [Streptomyces sp. NPDC057927]
MNKCKIRLARSIRLRGGLVGRVSLLIRAPVMELLSRSWTWGRDLTIGEVSSSVTVNRGQHRPSIGQVKIHGIFKKGLRPAAATAYLAVAVLLVPAGTAQAAPATIPTS